MKTTLQLLALMVFMTLSTSSIAQNYIGIRGGVNIAGIATPSEISGISSFIKPVTTTSLGLVTEFQLNEQLSFQPELAYTRKGFKIDEGLDIDLFNVALPVGVRTRTTFNYLEMPLLLKYSFGNEQVKAHVFGGPQLGYALSGRLKTSARLLLEIPLSNTELDLENIGYQRFEVGGTVGAGVSFAAGAGRLFMDARYTHGFNQLYDIPIVDLKLRNQNFGFNIGYMIALSE